MASLHYICGGGGLLAGIKYVGILAKEDYLNAYEFGDFFALFMKKYYICAVI